MDNENEFKKMSLHKIQNDKLPIRKLLYMKKYYINSTTYASQVYLFSGSLYSINNTQEKSNNNIPELKMRKMKKITNFALWSILYYSNMV